MIAPLALLLAVMLTWGSLSKRGYADQPKGRLLSHAKLHGKPHGSVTPVPTGIPGHWKLILNSSFSGHSLDTRIWQTGWFGPDREITGPINAHEAACYSSDNVSFPHAGGMALTITHTPSYCRGGKHPYTAAMVTTNPADRRGGGFQYRYGVLEARVFFPGIGGLLADWSSVATFGQVWPRDGEDDILEALSGMACYHFHSVSHKSAGLGACGAVRPGWHTVAANWQPGVVTYYYDGVRVGAVVKDVTSAPMYIALINTVSAKTPWLDLVDTMRVGYVRVWQTQTS